MFNVKIEKNNGTIDEFELDEDDFDECVFEEENYVSFRTMTDGKSAEVKKYRIYPYKNFQSAEITLK